MKCLELTFDDFVSELTIGSMQEIHLTDDLADSLVNPPTDLEDFADKFSNRSSETLVNLPTEFEVDENNEKVVSESNKALIDNFVVQNTDDNSEWEIIESKKRHVECVSLPVPVEVHYERSVTFDDSIKEDVKDVQEYLKGNIRASQTDQDEETFLENSEIKLKDGNTKLNKDPILVLNADVDIKVEISNEEKNSIQKVCPTEIKKSYSSIMKTNSVKTLNRNNTISSSTNVETVPSNLCCPAIQTRTEQEFDNVPLSVSKPDKRENISKRKHKNIKFEDSPLPGDLKLVAPVEKKLSDCSHKGRRSAESSCCC